MAYMLLLFLVLSALIWGVTRLTQPARVHRSRAQRRARQRLAGTLCLVLPIGAVVVVYALGWWISNHP
jgi:uncharacterized protein HemY